MGEGRQISFTDGEGGRKKTGFRRFGLVITQSVRRISAASQRCFPP